MKNSLPSRQKGFSLTKTFLLAGAIGYGIFAYGNSIKNALCLSGWGEYSQNDIQMIQKIYKSGGYCFPEYGLIKLEQWRANTGDKIWELIKNLQGENPSQDKPKAKEKEDSPKK